MDRIIRINERYLNLDRPNPIDSSLISFIRSDLMTQWLQERRQGKWCELGCGNYSVFEHEYFDTFRKQIELIGYDFSKAAINQARKWGSISYELKDIAKDDFENNYSVMVDGHFLHQLNSLPEVYFTLRKIAEALIPGGIFFGEVMMAHKKMAFKESLNYCEDTKILKRGEDNLRVILSSHEWEDLFLESGLKIKYFMCQSSIKFIADLDRSIPLESDPECLRFVLEREGVQ